ncbi:hypothetical protein ON021_25650, partial [Microcoleus sp. HI-ES]|nr:hypothetical protein [Microcoleus sp. HI-ES]MCZ0903282.1 hypothetical protein [Microcoleus sp. HI-ES]
PDLRNLSYQQLSRQNLQLTAKLRFFPVKLIIILTSQAETLTGRCPRKHSRADRLNDRCKI